MEWLPRLIAALPPAQRMHATRLLAVVASEGTIVPPSTMLPWLAQTFGSVELPLRQRITRVTNRWTFEGATFNALRALRPGGGTSGTHGPSAATLAAVRARIAATAGDDFCDPERRTPADIFGRVRGRRSVTAANVARADGWHGVVIFNRHDPLAFDAAQVADALATAGEWVERAHTLDHAARHGFIFWNCLPRAGASLVHGHLQMTLSTTMPHAHVALWHAAALRYQAETGADYFADLTALYSALGLSVRLGETTVLASLTPAKEREVLLLAPQRTVGAHHRPDWAALAAALTWVLGVLRERMGVLAFNVAIFGPPLGDEARGEWAGFPLVARVVDRGDPLAPTADIAAMELFASSVVAADPFTVAREFQAAADSMRR